MMQKTEENIGCEGMPVTEKELSHSRRETVTKSGSGFIDCDGFGDGG